MLAQLDSTKKVDQKEFTQTLTYYLQLHKQAPTEKLTIEIAQFYANWQLFEKAINFVKQNIKTPFNTSTLFLLAKWSEKSNQLIDAEDYYLQLLNQTDIKENEKLTILNIYTSILKKNKKFEKAIFYEKQHLEHRQKLNDTTSSIIILNNIGFSYKNMQNFNAALQYFKQANSLAFLSNNQTQYSLTLFNLTIINQQLGHPQQALYHAKLAIPLLEGQKKWTELSQLFTVMGTSYYVLQEYKKANNAAEKALFYAKKSNNVKLKITALSLLSKLSSYQHDFESSHKYLQEQTLLRDSIELINDLKNQEQQKNILTLEQKELKIKDLLIENDIKQLGVEKAELLAKNASTETELILKQKALEEINHKATVLLQQKKLSDLELKNNLMEIDARNKAYQLLKNKKELADLEKKNSIIKLEKQNATKALTIRKQEEVLTNQQIKQSIIITISIFVIVLGILIFYIYYYKQKATQSKLQQQFMEVQQRLLRSQMNPHFVFNSLNAIQSFVVTNNVYEAEKYMARFSRLIRLILENSSKAYVNLTSEIEQLKLYSELEQMRFNNAFEVSYIYDENLDTDYIFIPPMLIQPYIENAIVHGLKGVKENGKLTVTFELVNDTLLKCTVTDNGHGREAVALQQKNQLKTHKSMGTKLLQDRMSILANVSGDIYEAKIIDNYLDDKPVGTSVELLLTCKESAV